MNWPDCYRRLMRSMYLCDPYAHNVISYSPGPSCAETHWQQLQLMHRATQRCNRLRRSGEEVGGGGRKGCAHECDCTFANVNLHYGISSLLKYIVVQRVIPYHTGMYANINFVLLKALLGRETLVFANMVFG